MVNTETIVDRIDRVTRVVRDMLDGGKPVIAADDSGLNWLPEQMSRMSAGFFLSEPALSFYTAPNEGAEEQRLKGVTACHPLSAELVQRQDEFTRQLGKRGISNFVVLGAEEDFRDAVYVVPGDSGEYQLEREIPDPVDQYERADALLLTPGDLQSLWQFLVVLKAQLQFDPRAEDRLLVVQNSDRFWDPMVRGLRLGDLGEENVVQITPSYGRTARALAPLGEQRTATPHRPVPSEKIDVLMPVTRSSHKIREDERIIQSQKLNISVVPFNFVMNKPREAEEQSFTPAGNALEKCINAAICVDGMEDAQDRLVGRGAKPGNCYMQFDDRAQDLRTNLLTTGRFKECETYLNPYKDNGAGAEIAHVFRSMSRDDYYARLKAARDDIAKARNVRPSKVDISARESVIKIMCPVMPDEQGRRRIHTFLAVTDNTLAFDPLPANDENKYSEHYLRPKDDPGRRTAAQIPNFIETQSPQALALHAAIRALRLNQPNVKADFSLNAQPRSWRIGTPSALWGTDSQVNLTSETFEILDGSDNRYNPANKSDNETDGEFAASGLDKFHIFAHDADCFLFAPEPEDNSSEAFVRRAAAFFDIVVLKQIYDPVIGEKPIVVIDGPTWRPILNLYNALHRAGLAGDKPEHLFKLLPSVEEGMDYLQNYMTHYQPSPIGPREMREKGNLPPDDMFGIVVYCSATSTNELQHPEVSTFSFDAAAEGFAIVNGGGTAGHMIQSSNGVHNFRHWWDKHGQGQPPNTHVSSIQCEDTYQAEGLCDFNDYVCVHPRITSREAHMEHLGHAQVLFWGGAGSIDEALKSLILRDAGITETENRPLIIINGEIGEGAHKTHVFDPLLQYLSPDYLKRLNVHVVPDRQAAMMIARAARRACGMEPATSPNFAGMLGFKPAHLPFNLATKEPLLLSELMAQRRQGPKLAANQNRLVSSDTRLLRTPS